MGAFSSARLACQECCLCYGIPCRTILYSRLSWWYTSRTTRGLRGALRHLLHHARVSEHARHDRLTRRDSFGRMLVVSSFNFVTSQSVSLTKTHNLNVSKYLSQPLTIEPAQQNHGPRSVIVAQGARMRLTFYLTGEFETS